VLDQALADEVVHTLADVVAEDRPVDEWLTATRTWQSGWVRDVYLARELRGELSRARYDAALEERLLGQLRAKWTDPKSASAWVERPQPYTGSGLFFTPPIMTTLYANYRQAAFAYLESFLCSRFRSVRVDSEALTKAIGNHHTRLTLFENGNVDASGRSKNPLDAPMRHIDGCNGCHAPLDNLAASLRVIALHVQGGYPNRADTGGAVYVKGATDSRGEVAGLAVLNELVVKQPEFGSCMVERTFDELVGSPSLSTERSLVEGWTQQFERSGHRLRGVLVDMLASEPFRDARRTALVAHP
jgi:hypothetical protein